MEMKEKQQLLVDALRSGKYQFGSGYLRRKDDRNDMCEFCVAGVMCEEYRLLYPETSRWVEKNIEDPIMCFYDDNDDHKDDYTYWANPPDTVIDFFGMQHNREEAEYAGVHKYLNMEDIVGMNDLDRSHNFVEIADFLEIEWELR